MAYNPDEVLSVYNFLKQTPEGNLRKMMVGADFTDAQFRLLMKLAKGGNETDFIEAFQGENMGKLRLAAKEIPLRDAFWGLSKKKLVSLGLLQAQAA